MSQRKVFVPNSVGHFDIAGPDLIAISQFYTSVFDWKLNAQGPATHWCRRRQELWAELW